MRDLFGEVVVTYDDLFSWVEAVAPAFTSSTRAFEHYVHAWSVADKVRDAKLRGTFESTIEKARERQQSITSRLGLWQFMPRLRHPGR
ncbi:MULTISPECIES: hypothetical protein [unclassified Caballeronia]|uniref:hypothetical protein n=1 Tax=unclassified Caballeronia TaxID=2646786 RepID=UPI00202904E6|nr:MULTISPECIES: hypothetical protein [unclassified Caballeronia]MDR5797427.1 hypothetical protein [Caballeronia sp. LZ008]